MADKLGERGYHDSGVHGAIEGAVLELERLVGGLGNDRLLAKFLSVKTAEEEYIEAREDKDALEFAGALGEFTTAVAAARLPQPTRVELDTNAGRYRRFVERYVQMSEEIRAVKKVYLRSVQTIDPLLEKLYIGSLERVAAKRRAIERSTRLLSLPVIVVGAVVLVATALFSLTIALTVTRSVAESKAFAERIAAGDRRSRLVPAGRNEFFSLATALNTMSESLLEADRTGRSPATRCGSPRRSTGPSSRPAPTGSGRWTSRGITPSRTSEFATFSAKSRRKFWGLPPLSCSTPRTRPGRKRCSTQVCLPAPDGTGSCCGGVTGTEPTGGSNPTRWLSWTRRGRLTGFIGTDRDITERRKLEAELVKAQKLEAIGTLAGGIAHDFNNLLQGLFGYISLARLNLDRRDKAEELLEQAEKALNLSVNLTTQLLTFAKGGKPVNGSRCRRSWKTRRNSRSAARDPTIGSPSTRVCGRWTPTTGS